jgi:hypothetical protein
MAHETAKRQTAENIWLHYFNDELHNRSIISELERNKMALKIESLRPPIREVQRKPQELNR